MTPPDPWDADLSVIHTAVDNLGPWLAVWHARREPDAHARRCATDAIDAIDAMTAAAHRVGARLITETRQADDATAERVDALLARTREGPPGERAGGPAAKPDRHSHASSPPPPPQQQGPTGIVGRDRHDGRAPREEAR